MLSSSTKKITERILAVTGPCRIVHAGAPSLDLLNELLLNGCDAWAISDLPLVHPRALMSGDPRLLDPDTVIYEVGPNSQGLPVVNTDQPPQNLILYTTSLDRKSIDNLLFNSGWRRHPGGLLAHEYAHLTDERSLDLSFFQRIPPAANRRWPVSSLMAERNLHMDMLRETGPRADAHLVRYSLAAQHVRPGDRVLDCACGLGYGTAILASLSRGSSFLGVDVDQSTVDYATANYALPGISYKASDAANLDFLADNSIDVVVSFETIEHVEDWQKCVAEFSRVLRPDGRIIASVPDLWVDETGRDPNPYHFHAFDWKTFADGLGQHFVLEKRYAQSAPGGFKLTGAPRVLDQVPLDWPGDTEWLLAVCSGNFFKPAPKGAFTHPAFQPSLDAGAGQLIDLAPHYDNPYLYRPMVQMGERLDHPEKLALLASSVADAVRQGSADQGAAICVLGYRALEQRQIPAAKSVIDRIKAYQAATDNDSSNPHVRRWRLSLFYLAGRLSEMLGDIAEALRFLDLAIASDWRGFSPLIATKTIAACFHAGVLSLVGEDPTAALSYFRTGVEQALFAARSDPKEIIGSLDAPLPFGLQELAEVIDMGSQCANAVANLPTWERDRGAFWRTVDIRRFGLATWARELERANTELDGQRRKEQGRAEQAEKLSVVLDEQRRKLLEINGTLVQRLTASHG